MFIVVDRVAEEPAYGQIARQVRELIAAEKLKAGAFLPPVRSLASDLGVNLNTVARAYRVLEAERFVRLHARSGAEVLPPAQRARRETLRPLGDELRQLLARMLQAGMSAAELRRAVLTQIELLQRS